MEGTRGRTIERGADRFLADDAWLADDAREGRGVGLPGLAAAGAWLEERFRALGFAPAGVDGGYRQPFSIEVAVRSTAATRLLVDGAETAVDQFIPTAFSGAGPAEGPIVAAGWGITTAEKSYDDYASIDARGKIVLVRRFVPDGEAFKGTDQERRWGDLRYKAFNAREHGAIGLIVADLAASRRRGGRARCGARSSAAEAPARGRQRRRRDPGRGRDARCRGARCSAAVAGPGSKSPSNAIWRRRSTSSGASIRAGSRSTTASS